MKKHTFMKIDLITKQSTSKGFLGIFRLATIAIIYCCSMVNTSTAQTVGPVTGCYLGRWGIDAGLYSGVIEFGAGVEPVSPPRSRDWFQGVAGDGLISQTNTSALQTLLQAPGNPTYEARMKYPVVSPQNGQIIIDGLFARDQFGGTGAVDQTSYTQAAKNGEDPGTWPTGTSNVLGKNDIIDVGGHMYRDGLNATSNLWFIGFVNLAEPGGSAYMDFEFYANELTYNPTLQKLSSGGPNLGHTAYQFNLATQSITKIGDFLLAVNLGTDVSLDARVWVSRADWLALGGNIGGGTTTFNWSGTFDGAFNNAPFGYAGIVPKPSAGTVICGNVNAGNQAPLGPPWGTKTSKTNSYRTTYLPEGAIEVGIDLTSLGLDHSTLSATDPCLFPLASFVVKTRASQSFTAQLKDFGGPYSWAFGGGDALIQTSSNDISCTNQIVTVTGLPSRVDLKYIWKTADGNILNAIPLSPTYQTAAGLVVNLQGDTIAEITGNPWELQVNKAGTYTVNIFDQSNCTNLIGGEASATVTVDPSDPLFNGQPTISFTPPCNGNDGTVTTSVSGATPLYTFELLKNGNQTPVQTASNVASPHTFTGVDAGSYVVRVKGQSPCIVTSDAVVLPLAVTPIFTPTITSLNCFGDQNGSINLGTVTGKDPLTYEWSTGAQTPNLSSLPAGNYVLTITDADNCERNYPYSITSPAQITATFTKVNDPGNNNPNAAGGGEAEVNPTGGTAPYTYAWVKTGQPGYVFSPSASAKKIENLSYGEYVVTITDDEGCIATASVFIFERERCDDGIDNSGNGLVDCDDPICTPAPPSLILASDPLPCVGEQLTYTANLVAGITEYVWTLPANATLISGQNTNAIVVSWQDTNGGQICVRAKNFDCLSSPTCINVQVQDVPAQPNVINLNNN